MCARLDDVAQKVMQRLRPAEPVPMQDFETMRKQANLRVFLQLVNLNEERMVWADRMQRHLENTFKAIETLSVIAFAMGVVMIVVPFIFFYVSSPRDPNLLWFSGIGFAETLAVLIYKPMQRMQEAISDLIQAIVILNSWVTQIGLTLYGMDISQGVEVATATKTISDLTSKHIRWMQDYLEAKGPAGKSLRREGEEGGGPT